MHIFSVLTLCALSQAASLAARSPYAVKETHNVPRKWTRIGAAPKDHNINLQIGLKQSNFPELVRHLYEVSDPQHARYGQHLSAAEVNELVKPASETLDAVLEWLSGAGISSDKLSLTPAKDWIRVTLPVESVERLLDTEYSVYQHEEGHHTVRTPQWSLPLHLHEHIEAIQPTNSFMRPSAERSTLKPVKVDQDFSNVVSAPESPDVAKVCNASLVTPLCLRTLYGTVDYKPKAAGKNKVALNNYLGEVQARSDVASFLQMFRPDAVGAAETFKNVIIAGAAPDEQTLNSTQIAASVGIEGSLDAETILGIGFPTPLTAFSTGGSPPFIPDINTPTDTNEPYLTNLQFLLGLSDKELPTTISTSYGDDEQTVPASFAIQVCNMFGQLGARGVSTLHSSGDNGVGSNGTCISNDGQNRAEFLPAFPASCPFVTSVGATMGFGPEVVAHDVRNGFVSGGGFSNVFARPVYQDVVVPKYIASLDGEFSGLFNTSGRGYPDIAAQGVAFAVVWDGQVIRVDGTSAACPTAASVLSLVNDALIAAGKRPLGFLNPLLYSSLHNAFNDVVSGSAIGCNTAGFPAEKGWDPVTGFGTPNFPDIRKALRV